MKMFKKVINVFCCCVGVIGSYVYSYRFNYNLKLLFNKIYSVWISDMFKSFGKDSVVQQRMHLLGGNFITIGNKTSIGTCAVLTAWDKYGLDTFSPEIIIGNNVSIGDDCHITAINRIEIGNNVLTGKKITITDNAHGESNIKSISIPPLLRPLHSSGPVFIGDGVWIGDKVTILANVRIGKNAIIGSNAVVTKDIPANCIAVGIPAKVIKLIE